MALQLSGLQLRLWWIMAAVAVVAGYMASPHLFLLFSFPLLILGARRLVSDGWRVEAAYWFMALHPLLFLGLLSATRLDLVPMDIIERSPVVRSILLLAYISTPCSVFYLPLAFMIELAWAIRSNRDNLSIVLSLLVTVLVWVAMLIFFLQDPFGIFDLD